MKPFFAFGKKTKQEKNNKQTKKLKKKQKTKQTKNKTPKTTIKKAKQTNKHYFLEKSLNNDKLRAPPVINQASSLQRSTLTELYVNYLGSELEHLAIN